MADFMLMDGDTVLFIPLFETALLLGFPPVQIPGSGPATMGGKKICIEGDEANVSVAGVAYAAKAFVGGMGTLTIEPLKDHVATHTKVGGTPVLLVGGNFAAKLTVDAKGTDPSNGSQDPTPEYSGEGVFKSANIKVKGT